MHSLISNQPQVIIGVKMQIDEQAVETTTTLLMWSQNLSRLVKVLSVSSAKAFPHRKHFQQPLTDATPKFRHHKDKSKTVPGKVSFTWFNVQNNGTFQPILQNCQASMPRGLPPNEAYISYK